MILRFLKEITFEEPDMETFLGLPMAISAAKEGGSMPTVFNAANELAVKKFLHQEINSWIFMISSGSLWKDTKRQRIRIWRRSWQQSRRHTGGLKAGGELKFVIAVIIFSAIILIHELGHFLLAKKNGIIVTEFSLGMGPRLLSTVKGGPDIP